MRSLPITIRILTIILLSAAFLYAQDRFDDLSPSLDVGKSSNPAKKDPLGLGSLGQQRPPDAKTEITAQKQATFDNNKGVATFEGNVLVVDAQVDIKCDKLTVYLAKDRKGMERAEAEGSVVIIHKGTDTNGRRNESIAQAETAIYVPASGDVTLIGWPQVRQGINNHLATEESTRMILNREGRMTTEGPSRTVIIEGSQDRPQF